MSNFTTAFHLFPIRYYTVKRYKDAKIQTVKTLYYQINWKFKYVFSQSRKVHFQKFSGASGPTMVGPPTSQNIFFHSVIKYPLSAAVHFNDNSTYDPEDPDRDRLHKVRPLRTDLELFTVRKKCQRRRIISLVQRAPSLPAIYQNQTCMFWDQAI